jgi:hypothetical protein
VYKEILTTLHTNLTATYQVSEPNMVEVDSMLIVTKEVLDCLWRGLPKLPELETLEDVAKMDGEAYRHVAEFKLFVREYYLDLGICRRMIERDPRFVHVKDELAKLAEVLLKEANSM